MTKDEMLQREGLAWLVARLRWDDRLTQLRRAAGATTGNAHAMEATARAA